MGQYVTRTDPKTGKSREYYKADNGKLYNDYNAAASANMNPVARVQRWAGEKINQVFGTPTKPNYTGVVGKSTDSIFDDKGSLTPAAQTIIKQSNTGATIESRDGRNLLAKTAEQVSPIEYGNRAYANPYTNSTFVNNQNLGTLVHELGHLDRTERTGVEHFTRLSGVAGRALTEVGKLPIHGPGPIQPLNVAAGLVRGFVDAREEDVAERYRNRHSRTLFSDYDGDIDSFTKHINEKGSGYGNSERDQAVGTFQQGLDPTGLIRTGADFVNNTVVQPFQDHKRKQRITELTPLVQQDRERFQQLPEDASKLTSDQRTFMEAATRRSQRA